MKKILIGICGIGNGHINRQICVIEELKKNNYSILVATSIDKVEVIKSRCNVDVVAVNIPWIVCNDNGLNYKETLIKYMNSNQNTFEEFLNFSIKVEEYFEGKPDLVISDYEPYTARYSYASNVKLITMEQQSKFLYIKNYPIKNQSINEEISRLSFFFPKFDKKIISSFFPVKIKNKNIVIVPPIINKVPSLKKVKNKVLVYFSPYSFSNKYNELLNIIKMYDEYSFIIYTNEDLDKFKDFKDYNNLIFKKFSNYFKEDLASSEYLITTSGHQLLSESISIELPMLTIPLDTYEQNYNAQMISKYELGLSCSVITSSCLNVYFKNVSNYKKNIIKFKKKYYKYSWEYLLNKTINDIIN